MTSEPCVVTYCLLVASLNICCQIFDKQVDASTLLSQTFSVFASCVRLEAAWNILVPHNVHSTIVFQPFFYIQ